MKKSFQSLALVLFVLFLSLAAFSQIRETGTIHGNVQDEKGEALPGTTVKISGPNLIGGAKTYITDQKGYYRFPILPAGPYTVSVDLPGFAKLVREVMNLSANMTLTLDFKMVQSAVKEEVVVKANPPTIDITNSSTGVVVMSEKLMLSLPVSKEFGGLMSMATGIETEKFLSNSASAYGMGQGESNGYLFDGIDVSSSRFGAMYFSPDFNTLQEASISGIGLSAEFGGFTGAVLSAITKSGSNRFSGLGEVWYTGRDWNSQNLGKYTAAMFVNPADKDKKFETGSYIDIGLQSGGRIIQDKLWFFLSGQYDHTKKFPLGYAEDQIGMNMKGLLKLSYQLSKLMKINLSISYDNEKVNNTNAVPYVSPEADFNTEKPGLFLNLNTTYILSQNTLLEFKLGHNRKKEYMNTKNGSDLPGHYDMLTGVYSVNGYKTVRDQDRTSLVSAHLSHYFPELLVGSHDMKIGAELLYCAPIMAEEYSGGVLFWDYDGQPYMKEVHTPANNELNHYFSTTTAFAQDSWRVSNRLTLNIGLRFDYYLYKIPTTGRGVVYKNQNFSPRLGFAYDVLGDRKNVIKFHYGHYYDKLRQSMFANADTRAPELAYYFWNGSDWDYSYSDKPDVSLYQVDPNVKQPYIREISVAFERELFRDASLSINYYYRKAARFMGWINTAGQWKEVEITNPGFDGITGTADDLGTMIAYERLNPGVNNWLLTNPQRGQSQDMVDDLKYAAKGLEVIFAKRYSNRWQMIATYHYTRVKGNTARTFPDLASGPNYFVNAYGDIGYYYGQPHQIKIQANILLPWDINFGVVSQYSSGADKGARFRKRLGSANVALNLVSPGTYEYDPKKQVDLRMQKEFDIMKGRFSLMADIINVFNSSRVLQAYNYVGSRYDKIYYVQTPRTFRIGLRFTY